MGVQQAGRTEAVVDFKKKKKNFFFYPFLFIASFLPLTTLSSLAPPLCLLVISSPRCLQWMELVCGSAHVLLLLFCFFLFSVEKKREEKEEEKKEKKKKKKAEKKKAEKKRKQNKKKKDRERKGTQERPRAASMDFLASSLFCGTSLTLPRSIRTAFVLPLS